MLFWALAVWFGPTTAATTGFAVECDGNQTRIAYDAPSFSSFNYDSGAVLLADGESERSQRPNVHFAKFGKFLAADSAGSEVTSLTKFYPGNQGFAGATDKTFLMPGQTIDRYGGSGVSRFFSPQGTPDWARSLPPGTTGQPLRTFQVMKPFEVDSGEVAPWFNQPGGGLQYRTPVNLNTLLKRGIIQEITP